MKQYFAKYLPVEGEIKVGDKYFDDKGNIKTERYWQTGNYFESDICDNPKLAKLFLCSRDIQVGDRVRSFAEPTVEDILNPQMQTSHKFSGPDAYSFFKVIGEISPEATWVKEGDEFEEEINDPHIWVKGQPIIEIKCPTCKKFH